MILSKKQLLLLFFGFLAINAFCQTSVVLLGTGTPNPDIERFGPSLAIVVNNTPYIVDCGPGVVRRCAAAEKKGIKGLNVTNLNHLFITHLHSDHTSGLSDFIFTPAVIIRKERLKVFGPKGTKKMTKHIMKAFKEDIDLRVNGLEHGDANSYKLITKEISEGIIYSDSNVLVKAFKVNHGSWKEAYGYRFETKDKIIVVSGDCTYSENLIKNSKDCDILIHEVYSQEGFETRTPQWKAYHSQFHTSTKQLAAIANSIKPKLLVLTHQLIWTSTEEKLLQEVKNDYKGKVISGHDLDIFDK
jgi:ribonuclease BN (tRNA processing enzyme)